jgi:DNA-binding MarR family transcriptional regulator
VAGIDQGMAEGGPEPPAATRSARARARPLERADALSGDEHSGLDVEQLHCTTSCLARRLFDIERLAIFSLDVKHLVIEDKAVSKTPSTSPTSTSPQVEQDHVDRFLESVARELPELDLAVEGIVDRIMGLGRRLKRMLEETLEANGLSHGEWQVLGALRLAGPPYRRSPGQLCERCELSSAAMTNRLDRLEAAGFVRRLPNPTDRRALQVELTDEGRRVWQEAVGAQAAKEGLVASALDAREQERLNDLLRRLMLAFERIEEGTSGKAKNA